LPDIGEYDIVRGDVPAVDKHVSAFVSRIEAGEGPDVLAPVFVRGRDDAIPDSQNTRGLVTTEVRDRLLRNVESEPERERAFLNAQVRIVRAEFGLGRTADSPCLVSPSRADGEWRATLVSETETAVQWGEELFEALWADADAIDDPEQDSFELTGRRGMVGRTRSDRDSRSPY